MTNYLLAGGGTAGHVNPLLALAELIREEENNCSIVALGTAEGLEARLVPERGFELATIARLPFPRKPSVYALKFPLLYARAITQVKELIRERKIDAVVGFGGYAAAPAYTAAKQLGVPYIIHEANALPGLANRLGAKNAAAVAVTFAGTALPRAQVTGMPLRKEITSLNRSALRQQAADFFGVDVTLPTLLVTGGSLGARAINEGISQCAAEIVASGAQVLHIWGGLTELRDPQIPGYHVAPYCDRMDLAFALADLAVSRAGATTVSEIAGLHIPAFFAPYSHGNGEQELNSRAVITAGGAFAVSDNEITAEWVKGTLLPLLHNPARLQEMSANAAQVANLQGTQKLYELVQQQLPTRSK